jgi:hypothetical protein
MNVNLKQWGRQAGKQLMNLPGSMDAYVWFTCVLGKPAPYFPAWRHLPGWLEELDSVIDRSSTAPRPRFLFFSSMHYWVNYLMAVAVVLAARDIDVDVAWLVHPNISDDTPVTGDAHWRRSVARALAKCSHPRVRLINLEGVDPAPTTDEMRAGARAQAEIDASYILMKERLQYDSKPEDRAVIDTRTERNVQAVARVATLLRAARYDRIVLPSGTTLEHGALYTYATQNGVPVSSIEMIHVRGSIVVSSDVAVSSINTERLWADDEPHVMTEKRRASVRALMDLRQNPAPKNYVVEYQHVQFTDAENLRIKLGLRADKPVVLVCPNIPFDAVFYVERNKNFKGMWEWLVKTVEFLAERTDCEVILRCHPAEVYCPNCPETVQSLLAEFFPSLPSHIKVIPPTAKLNTYSIMKIADMGLVYASTTAIEMAAHQIPVVCGMANQHYNQKGFTHDPATLGEYFGQIDMILSDPSGFKLSERQIELAWCYYDVYFNKWPLPFPWHVSNLGVDIKEWPIKRMLSAEGQQKFGRTLDVLAGM